MRPIELECPLCAKNNECAVVVGQKVSDCWCHQQCFSKSSRPSLLANNTHQCVCQSCLKQMSKTDGKR